MPIRTFVYTGKEEILTRGEYGDKVRVGRTTEEDPDGIYVWDSTFGNVLMCSVKMGMERYSDGVFMRQDWTETRFPQIFALVDGKGYPSRAILRNQDLEQVTYEYTLPDGQLIDVVWEETHEQKPIMVSFQGFDHFEPNTWADDLERSRSRGTYDLGRELVGWE